MRSVFPAVWPSKRAVWLLLALALLLAVASVVPALLALVVAGGAAFVALAAADAALGPRAASLRIARQPLPPLALGRSATIAYALENRTTTAVRIGVFESPLPAIAFLREPVLASLGPRSRADVTAEIRPRERGRVRFGPLYLWAENGIGLLQRRFCVDALEDARVFPDLSAVTGTGVVAQRSTLLDAGLRRLRRRGAGTEFESLREYAPGDAFRQIDWKATARRGRMMTAHFEVERSQNVVIALDCGRLMTPRVGDQRKFDYALTAALSVARIAQRADDHIGLLAFAAQPLVSLLPRRGAAHYTALAAAAFDLQPRFEEPDYETIFAGVRRRASKRSLVVLFTDIFDPVTSAAVLAGFGALVPRHVAVCVLMNDAALARALDREPANARDAYRASVALTLAEERMKSVALLRARGIIVVDVPASNLTIGAIDAYLDVKARGML